MRVGYALCSAYGLPLLTLQTPAAGDGEAGPGAVGGGDGEPVRSLDNKFWRGLSQAIVIAAGTWRVRAPFRTKFPGVHCYVIPYETQGNVLFSCFVICDLALSEEENSQSYYLASFVALRYFLHHSAPLLPDFLSDLTQRMDHRTHDSTFVDSVEGDDWWEDFISDHIIQEAFLPVQNTLLPKLLSGDANTLCAELVALAGCWHKLRACSLLAPGGAVCGGFGVLYHCPSSGGEDDVVLTTMMHCSLTDRPALIGPLRSSAAAATKKLVYQAITSNSVQALYLPANVPGGVAVLLVGVALTGVDCALVALLETRSPRELVSAVPTAGQSYAAVAEAALAEQLRDALLAARLSLSAALLVQP